MNLVLSACVVLLLVPFAAAADRDLAPLPQPVTSLGAAVVDGYAYVYGGHAGKPHSYSNETTVGSFRRLNLKDPSKWEDLPGGSAVQGLAGVGHGGKFYRLGGMQPRNGPKEKTDSVSLPTVARFDPASGKWEQLPDLPAGRSSHDAVVVGDKIYVAGGWKMNGAGNDSEWHDSALVLDLGKTPLKWERLEQPFKRRALTMAAHDGKVYVIAGLNPDGAAERTVNIYDPTKKEWTKGPDIPEGVMNGFTPAACSADGRLYLSPADGKLYRLTDKGDRWEEVGALRQSRVVHRMLPEGNNRLLVIGGSSKGAPTGELEEIQVAK